MKNIRRLDDEQHIWLHQEEKAKLFLNHMLNDIQEKCTKQNDPIFKLKTLEKRGY